jgi:glutamate-1-semialdehyde 2,1-aminomutase
LPVDFPGAKQTSEPAYAAFFRAALDAGLALAPGAYEALFVGLGHTDEVIDRIGDAAHQAAQAAVATLAPR